MEGDDAADVAPRHVRQRHRQRRQPLAQPQIDVIERRGRHAHLNLAGPGRRRGNIADLHDLGAAVTAKPRRAHGRQTDLSAVRAAGAAERRASPTTAVTAARNASMVASGSSPMFETWMWRSASAPLARYTMKPRAFIPS